jgi:hypothetical protein
LQNDDVAQEYFSHLEIILKNTVDDDAYHLYVQKLRDWSLMKDPAFRWCAQVSCPRLLRGSFARFVRSTTYWMGGCYSWEKVRMTYTQLSEGARWKVSF